MRRTGMTWLDLMACVVLLVLALAFTVVGAQAVQLSEDQKQCAANLRQIGQAILLYSNENRGAYPRTIASKPDAADPKPVWGTPYRDNPRLGAPPQGVDPFAPEGTPAGAYRVAPNDVTAALYLLLRTQDITGKPFVCPEAGLEPSDFGGGTNTALNWTNWAGDAVIRRHLSYSYQNPYPKAAAIAAGFKLNNTISAEFAVAADMNPGVDALLTLTPASPPEQLRDGNTRNHDGEGQNVLFGDGHVEFVAHPFVGVNRDNVYTYGDSGRSGLSGPMLPRGGDGIVGSPVGPADSILLPTARDVGALDEAGRSATARQWDVPTPEQADAARQQLVGRYKRTEGRRTFRLEVTPAQIVGRSGPLVVTFAYTVDRTRDGQVRLALTAPETDPASAKVVIESTGLLITGTPFFNGRWQRE